jgi:hypothetical protein
MSGVSLTAPPEKSVLQGVEEAGIDVLAGLLERCTPFTHTQPAPAAAGARGGAPDGVAISDRQVTTDAASREPWTRPRHPLRARGK